MKRFSITILAFFIGCGSGGNTTQTYKTEGKVVDGYVKNAIVCADLNKNFICEKEEPKAITDEKGNFSLITNSNNFVLISKGGIDTQNNSPAITMYSLPKYKNITPLTTLAVKEGEEKVAEYFNIKPEDISKDPMKDNTIQNIVINIVNEIKTKGNFEINSIKLPKDIKPTISITEINSSDTNISSKEINLSDDNNNSIETNISTTKESKDIPPQITGPLTPPKIGE